jgi:hypothetical protein
MSWDLVEGLPEHALCADVNDGECPKWEARAPSIPSLAEVLAETEPPPVEMFPQPDPHVNWWVGVVLAAAVIAAGVGVYVWFVSQNGWRWW